MESSRYTVYLSDECILAPMAYFHTELLELTRSMNMSGIRFMGSNPGDPEDPHDNIYLSETSRKYTKVRYISVEISSMKSVLVYRILSIRGRGLYFLLR